MRNIYYLALLLTMVTRPCMQAQDMAWTTNIPAVAGTDILGMHLRDMMERQRTGAANQPAQNADPATPSSSSSADSLRYTPSSKRRKANLDKFVARSRAVDPQGADNLAKLFASTDVVEAMRVPLAAVGLRLDDVADAYTAWWINAWQAGRGVDKDVSAHMAGSVRAQAARAIVSSGVILRADDAARQELAESLLIQATLIAAAMEQAKGNLELNRQIAVAVTQGARGMNVDLAGMTLTEEGFTLANR